VEDIPSILNIDVIQVDNLAKTLEKAGLIEIHYPTVGSPILRVKGYTKKNRNKKEKKKLKIAKFFDSKKLFLIIGIAIVLLIVVGGVLVVSNMIKNIEKEEIVVEEVVEEEVVEVEIVEEIASLEMAFSGNGSYYCDVTKSGFDAEYWILDDKEKIITKLGTEDSIVIIKDEFIYTYILSSNTWLKTAVNENTARPGVKVPELDIASCKTYLVEESLFEIPSELIV